MLTMQGDFTIEIATVWWTADSANPCLPGNTPIKGKED